MLIIVTVFIPERSLRFMVASMLTKITEGVFARSSERYISYPRLSVSSLSPETLGQHLPSGPTIIFNKALLPFLGLGDGLTTRLARQPERRRLWAVIWIMIWQGFGWALLFFYGGLMTVPKELEEAAIVDGANKRQLYTNVVLPYMMPVLQSIIIIDVVSSLKQMEMIYLSTEGGPGNSTQFIALYLYQRAFKYAEYGYGNAISVLFVIIAVALTVIIQRMFRKSVAQI